MIKELDVGVYEACKQVEVATDIYDDKLWEFYFLNDVFLSPNQAYIFLFDPPSLSSQGKALLVMAKQAPIIDPSSKNPIKVQSYINMSLIPFRDLKFLKLLLRIQAKYAPKEAAMIRQLLNSQIIRFPLANPFHLHPYPDVTEEQIPALLLFMGKQMEEVSIRNLSLNALENFVAVNLNPLKRVLAKKPFHCQVFCMALLRYLQEYARTKELTHHVGKLRLAPFLELFIGVLEVRKEQKILKPTTTQEKECNALIHYIFNALLFIASAKFIKEAEEKQLKEERYMELAIRAACLIIDQCESQQQFQVVRQYLSIVSHLLVFSGLSTRPNKMLDFCLENDQLLYLGAEINLSTPKCFIDRYVRSLYAYSLLDPKYTTALLKLLRTLLTLNIYNSMVQDHFQVLLELIRSKVFIGLKKQVFDVLIQSQSKRNLAAIDELFMRILGSGIDLMDDEIQPYLLILAQTGQKKRKQQFALLYYHHYQSSKKLNSQMINFILEIYLEQQLPLEKMDLMVGKEANAISAANMRKLHLLVGQNRQNSIHRQLLSIIIEKRKDNAFKPSNKKSSHPFLTQDWLAALGNNAQIYKDYASAILTTLCGRSLEIEPVLINMKSYVVKVSLWLYSKIQAEFWSRSLEFYSIVLRSAERYDVYQEKFFRYMILMQALFGNTLPLDSYSYFSKYFCKIVHPQQSFLTFLEYQVSMLRNKSAMLLYLQAILEFNVHIPQLFYQKKLYDIFFLANLVEEQYAGISTYSFESVIILYQLSLFVKDTRFQQDYMRIMQKWSSLMSRSQCKQFQYLFSFRQIKKIYPFMKERQMKEPTDRIKFVWDTVLKMIGQKAPKVQYISMAGNRIIVDWKVEEMAKRGIQIAGTFLRNKSIQFCWDMRIQAKQKNYNIILNNDRAIIQEESKQLRQSRSVIKESNIKELKKHARQNINFHIRLQSQAKKMRIHLKVCDFEVIDHSCEGNIMQIRINCKDNPYLKDVRINEAFLPGGALSLPQHIVPLNRWQIKILSLDSIVAQSFGQKFDFQHAFCCIGQMLLYFPFVNLPFAYDILIKLAAKMINYYRGANFSQMQVIMQIFDLIDRNYPSMKGRGKTLLPSIELDCSVTYPKSYYYLMVSAILPKNFWLCFSEDTKKHMKNILFWLQRSPQFREIQNKRILLFDQLLDVLIQHEYLFEVCEKILDTHEMNNILSKKFTKLLLLSQQSIHYRRFLAQYLHKNFQYLNIQTEEHIDKRLRCKFLLTTSQKHQQQLFKLCTIQTKISILSYHSQHPNGEPTGLNLIKRLIGLVNISQKDQVIIWLIVQVRQLIFTNITLKSDQRKPNFQMIYLYLELLLMNRQMANNQDRSEIDQIIYNMLYSSQNENKNRNSLKQESKSGLETFSMSTSFIEYLKQITRQVIQKFKDVLQADKKDKIVRIYDLSIGIITKFQKNYFFEFMIKYRYQCSHDCKLLKTLIQHQAFRTLKLAHFSIFLQYIFQILLLIQRKSNFTLDQCQQLIVAINQYLQFIINTLDQTCMPKALFYNYPRLSGNKEGLSETGKVLRRMKRVTEQVKFLQLRGGIYFKCVLIINKLMKLNPSSNYNNLIEYFLFGPHNSYNKESQIFKAPTKMPDLVSTSTLTVRQRSAAQSYTADVAQEYKLYFNLEDYPRNVFNEETDLSNYIADYFLMSIAQFLQENGEKLETDLLDKYTNSFLRGISNHKIGKELLIASANNYEIIRYDDVTRIIQDEMMRNNRQRPYPQSPARVNFVRRAESAAFEEVRNYMDKEADQYSPRRRLGRKKTEDYSLQIKKRIQIIDDIKNDCKNWFKSARSKRISSFFCDKAKEIRIIELMHTHFVIKNMLLQQGSEPNSDRKEKQAKQAFNKDYVSHLKYEKKELGGQTKALLQQKIRKVRKIYPYTSQQPPVLNIISNCLTNMTCPITLKITNNDYDIRRHNESICMRYYLQSPQPTEDPDFSRDNQFYGNEHIEDSVIVEQIKDQEEEDVASFKEKPYCQLVMRQGSYFCEYRLAQSLVLQSKKDRSVFDSNLWYLKLGTPNDSLIKSQIRVEIRPEDVIEILYRRFNQTTNNSLQFFLKDGTSKFVTFYRRQNLASIIKSLQRIFKGVKIVKDVIKEFEDLKYTDKWIEGSLSNFDYLMLLNKYSGRSYNDINQYYVFPWVLRDYSSQKIDLTDPDSYRDLSKPIGALNPQKLRRYISKYRSQTNNPQKCLYGSHYSTSLFVFYYLVRLQPYSSLHRDMQKGTWDSADRLFSSIQQVWDSLCNESNTSDIKECIPEFYYMPAFLRNIANIQLGKKQCGSAVGDVELPPWAKTAQQFVVTMRAALQSDYVSENLHLWIDLIFGKYQNSQQKFNVFHPYSYSDPEVLTRFNSKNTREIQGKICQIAYFGQCPIQLFKKQHKPKKTLSEIRPTRSTYNIRSQTVIPLAVIGQASIMPGWNITEVFIENGIFIIEMKNVTKQEKQAAIISAYANWEALKESLQNLQDVRKNEGKGGSQARVSINQRNQISIGKEFLMDLDVRFIFSKTELNQLWIACYGCKGIHVYNWQLELNWRWEHEEVREVHLQATRIIFSTPSGKLYSYSFLDRKIQEIVVFKDVCDMIIRILPLPRLPKHDKNQINYKVLCIGDRQRVAIANISFEQSSNYTSLSRP